MRLIKKIFNKFFLLEFFFAIVIFSKLVIANNQNEANTSILKRLPTSIFATINGEPISIYDLIQRSLLFSISAKISINEEFETKVLPDLISGYIDEVIKIQQIKKENIFISDDQISQMILQIEKENGFKKDKLKEYLKENNTDISILEKQLESTIGWKQLIANKFRKQVVIQDSEIETIHKKLKSNIGKEEFFIEQIFLSFENKKKENDVLKRINNLYEQIVSGGDFGSIAKQFSDTFGGKVGKIGWMAETDLDEKIVNDVKKLEINKISKPLKGENGYFIIKVLNKRIIGDEIINQVSLFRFKLIETNDKINLLLNKIKNCNELEEFSKKWATADSGSLGMLNFNEISDNLKSAVKKMKKNQIQPIKYGSEEFLYMLCDIEKTKPIIPSKFKITDILTNQKLDKIARQYMSELRSKAIIDIRI